MAKPNKNSQTESRADIDISSTEGVGEISKIAQNSEEKREDTRSYIAIAYIVAYFFIILTVIAIAAYKNFTIEEYKDILLAISGVTSGPLGIMIGFYFKDKQV